MITDLFEGRRCVCGHPRWTRLYQEESPARLSYVVLCDSCGRISRAVWSVFGQQAGEGPRRL